MMKKIMALVLSLALLLSFALAGAEEAGKQTIGTISINGAFTLKGTLPAGYQLVPVSIEQDQVIAMIAPDDPAAPFMTLSVAFDETYSDVDRMNDLDDEALALLEDSFIRMDPTVEISYGETYLGTRLLIARQMSGDYHYIDFLSVYKGYFIEFVLTAGLESEDKTLTNEQVLMCVQFLTDLDFVPGIELSDTASMVAGKTYTAVIGAYHAEDNTLDVKLLTPIVLSADAVNGLAVGDTLKVGDEEILVETLETIEDTQYINDEYELRQTEDGAYNVYCYDAVRMETVAELTLPVPDTLVFLDDIDPESLEMLDEPAVHTAGEFLAALEAEAVTGPGFDMENVYVTFDAEGRLSRIDRFYVPWQ